MVYISPLMLKIVENRAGTGPFTVEEVKDFLEDKERLSQILFDMYVQGLLDLVAPRTFSATEKARELLELWNSLGRPSADPWIDTRIYTMVTAALEAGSVVPEKWFPTLEERGLARGGRVTEDASRAASIVASLEKRLYVPKPLARLLISLPEGPAANTYYRGSPLIEGVEALGLVAASVPLGHFMALTRPGRLLRRALQQLNLEAGSPVLVDMEIIGLLEKASSGSSLTGSEKRLLGELGYISAAGALRPAARLVLAAWRYIREPYESPPFALSRKELLLMERVEEQWRKAASNPEEAPTPKLLKEKLSETWRGEYYSVTLTLYHLEAMGLVERDLYMGREVVRLTRHGKSILGASGGRPSTALASRALIETDAGRGPSEDWIWRAREEGLLGVGGPTRYGRALAVAARESEKSLFLTGLEAAILKRLPTGKSIRREEALSFSDKPEEASLALDKLETRGLVKTTAVGYVAITDLGLKVKEVVIGVGEGIATPINPVLVKVLQGVAELGTEDPARLVNTLKLDIETLKKALILARSAKYIGKGGGLTESGRALLEIVEMLRREAASESGM